jgi:magnesium chelatase subunit D
LLIDANKADVSISAPPDELVADGGGGPDGGGPAGGPGGGGGGGPADAPPDRGFGGIEGRVAGVP